MSVINLFKSTFMEKPRQMLKKVNKIWFYIVPYLVPIKLFKYD